jgi:hypothetical protein
MASILVLTFKNSGVSILIFKKWEIQGAYGNQSPDDDNIANT